MRTSTHLHGSPGPMSHEPHKVCPAGVESKRKPCFEILSCFLNCDKIGVSAMSEVRRLSPNPPSIAWSSFSATLLTCPAQGHGFSSPEPNEQSQQNCCNEDHHSYHN